MSTSDMTRVTLSAEGLARKERMLGELLAEAERVKRRRAAAAGAGVVGLLAVAAVSVGLLRNAGGGREIPTSGGGQEIAAADPTTRVVPQSPTAQVTPAKRFAVEVVGNRPGIVEKYLAPEIRTVAVREVDDAQLRRAVAENGPPGGLVRIGGKVMLAADVLKAAERSGEPSSMRGGEAVMTLVGGAAESQSQISDFRFKT